MTSLLPSVFVCGITGFQGGAIAKFLLQLKWEVHATVRNLETPKAVALATAGAKLTKGDWDNEEALKASMHGCSRLFLSLPTTLDDLDRERRQAVRIVNIAKRAGIKQVVTSTSLGVSLYDGNLVYLLEPGSMMHAGVKIKKEVEETVEYGGFDSYTFLRPAYFMTNFLDPVIEDFSEILTKGTWSTVFEADTRVGLTDNEDTAILAVTAFQNPEKFNGRAFGIVSQFLTPQQILDVLSNAMGRPGLQAIYLSEEEIAALPAGALTHTKHYVLGHKCLTRLSEVVDLQELSSLIPLTTFEEFLEREKDNVRKM